MTRPGIGDRDHASTVCTSRYGIREERRRTENDVDRKTRSEHNTTRLIFSLFFHETIIIIFYYNTSIIVIYLLAITLGTTLLNENINFVIVEIAGKI